MICNPVNTGSFLLSNFSNAQLKWDEENKPRSRTYDDIYFSSADAPGESSYIFLEQNQLKQRWSQLKSKQFTIAECGFGSGLNFLNTCHLWCEYAPPDATLHYIACEQHPLLLADMLRLHKQWPQFTRYSKILLQSYPDHSAGLHRLHLTIGKSKICLDLLYGDAYSSLSSLCQTEGARVDAWYLDGFSPKLNPAMWSPELFSIIARLSKADTSLTSYSVAGEVKRGLRDAGFKVSRHTGYANKRHMLVASFSPARISELGTSKHCFTLPSLPQSDNKTVTIIGAGLAGCSTAFALARKGWKVTVLERQPEIASMASGNPQGIVHCKVSKSPGVYSRFCQQAYLYAIRQYQSLQQEKSINWHQCGSIQLAFSEEEKNKQQAILELANYSRKVCQMSSAQQNSQLAGLAIDVDGLLFPDSGWLNPRQLCQAYLEHPAINLQVNTDVLALKRIDDSWHIHSQVPGQKDKLIINSTALIIANSHDAESFTQTSHYPLIINRGQVDFLKASSQSKKLSTILCTNAYLIPESNGAHSIGGSFSTKSYELEASVDETEKNLKKLEPFIPAAVKELKAQKQTGSRVALRCSTPDYIPVVGPVEHYQDNRKLFSGLSLNARKKINQAPQYLDNLYINVAHGSHGLSSTPLAAEYIAALLNRETLPLPEELVACLHPMRFLIRDLKKQR